jgi:putative ABC transport system permease protein
MQFLEILRISLAAIRANKLRSMLTTLGMVIGVGAVITMISLGTGAKNAVQAQLDELGTDILTIYPGMSMWRGVHSGQSAQLTLDDVEALKTQTTTLTAVVPTLMGRYQAKYGVENANVRVMATTSEYADVSRSRVELGRFFTDQDDISRHRVAVLGWEIPSQLNTEGAELVGREISIGGIYFEVIGILERKGEQPGPDPDEIVYLPFNTARQRLFGSSQNDQLGALTVQMISPDSMNIAMLEIESVLRGTHRIRPGRENDFRILDRSQFLEARSEANETLGYLLAGIAAISLIVGGIGIMNIMLVSVTERTREIGIRKAIGASRRSVLLQFLGEAVTLSLMGGIVGILAGFGASRALSYFQGWETAVSPEAILMAVGFSATVGIFFGVWPARKAARLDPIEALRYE